MKEAERQEMALFGEALEYSSRDEQAAYVNGVCGADSALRARVDALLAAHHQAGAFLNGPQSTDSVVEGLRSEGPGTIIGPFKLLEQIGEGGFGVVFMAEQHQPVRRKVALKIIKPGMDTRQVVARFEAEQQALALMDHPNIAHVFDGGVTANGRPYFVMELVRGVPITEFCDHNQVPIRERLELFISVCQAVQHAHQKGIIHRDLKPNNVLVTLHDDKSVVKVIDFGIAKAVGRPLTEKTLFTNFAQMVGTPVYMSPEQAQMSGLDIDTRSDIYSLGVMLYELLTGMTPLDSERLRTAGFDEIRRIIREEDPATPSTRMSTLGMAGSTVCANRRSDPAQLSKLFKSELDWIVMRALEKDRNRRYETASAFAADVERYLKDEQVQACPPTLVYRLRKFARRNKVAVAVAGLVGCVLLLLLVLGIGVFVNNTMRDERDLARANEKRAETAEQRALDAEREVKIGAHLARAGALRRSGQIGQRYRTIAEVAEALKLNPSPESRRELRTEATAALVLPDVEVAQEWDGLPDGALGLAFDAEFQRFARLNRDGSVTVGRLIDNREEVIAHSPVGGKPPYYRLWMSPDGRFVAYGHTRAGQGEAAGLCVWKLDGVEPTLLLDVPEGVHGNAVAFRPDGRQLAVGHVDSVNSVSIYDLATGKRVQRLNAITAVHLAFHPRDSRLALARHNAGVMLFDVDTGAELPALRHPPGISFTYSVAWHPDGRRLAAGCNDRKIHIWDTETGTETMPAWVGTGGDGSVVAFNHTGDRLGSTDWSGLAHLWDTATGRLLLTVPSVWWQFSPSDKLHGYIFEGSKVKVWRLAAGRELRVLRRRNADSLEQISNPVVHADGRILAASSRPWLCFFDLTTGEELASVRMAADMPVHFHDSIGWLTGGPSGLLQWPARSDPARPEVMRVGPPEKLSPGAHFATGASASADGRVVAVPDGTFTALIDREHPERRFKLGPQLDVRFAAVSPNGHWVATCSWFTDGRSKSTRIWDAATGRQVDELPLEGPTRASFSPDGRWLATGNAGTTQLWKVGTWQPGRRFDGSALFSPDSRLVALSGGVIRLVEAETDREIARLTGPDPGWYAPACFTPDGTRLIATTSDAKTILVWDLRAIRQQLKAMGLDWDWPEFGPADSQAAQPIGVEVVNGDPSKLVLSPEEKARQAIERYRLQVKANPDNPKACNGLAWAYLTAPEPLRDVKAALPLAEKAARLDAGNADHRNTLGVAYYRAGQYREAVEILQVNLDKQHDKMLAYDLYFLAMSHHRLGDTTRARDYFAWAVRWSTARQDINPAHLEELNLFRAEAAELLGIKSGS